VYAGTAIIRIKDGPVMKKSIHPAIEEIHEVRRTLFKRFNRDTQTFGKYLAERQRMHGKADSRKVKAAA